MAYSTQSDIVQRLEEATLIQLTDVNETGQVDSAIVASAIEGADALINSLISPIYLVPLANVPKVIREHSVTIAVYRIHLFRSVDPGVWKQAYESAIEFFQRLVEGKATLEGIAPKPELSATLLDIAGFSSEDRKFSRKKLEGW